MHDYTTEIITASDGSTSGPSEAHGWGDEARQTVVNGKPLEITVHRDGAPQFGFRVCEDGTLVITDYAGLNYNTWVPQNVVFRATRPWEDGEPGCAPGDC